MHGSWRRDGTVQYLSISMPNTFSMSPAYVEKFIREKGLEKLDQDVFECLRDKLARLYLDDTAGVTGKAYHADAAKLCSIAAAMKPGSVDLVVTSPPYLQVVNYGTANWIRLWLLGSTRWDASVAQAVSSWTQLWTIGTPTPHTASSCCAQCSAPSES